MALAAEAAEISTEGAVHPSPVHSEVLDSIYTNPLVSLSNTEVQDESPAAAEKKPRRGLSNCHVLCTLVTLRLNVESALVPSAP